MNHSPSTDLQVNDKKVRIIGSLIVLLTLGFFALWSFFAPIDSAALAPGQVVVKSHSKTVQHLEGGIVAKILVKDGDLVKAGQPIIAVRYHTSASAIRNLPLSKYYISGSGGAFRR